MAMWIFIIKHKIITFSDAVYPRVTIGHEDDVWIHKFKCKQTDPANLFFWNCLREYALFFLMKNEKKNLYSKCNLPLQSILF